VKYTTATQVLRWYWAELIWNIASLFGRQTVSVYLSVAIAGDKYCIFGWVQGAVED